MGLDTLKFSIACYFFWVGRVSFAQLSNCTSANQGLEDFGLPLVGKIRVDGTTKNTLEYEIVQVVDTGPILRDMAFSVDHEHLYIMSEKQNGAPHMVKALEHDDTPIINP
ncbi:hypothetical protein Q9233_013304 [Columba guinea]|nr:hypothetical protein Q9233_013304 [Columba guinea]